MSRCYKSSLSFKLVRLYWVNGGGDDVIKTDDCSKLTHVKGELVGTSSSLQEVLETNLVLNAKVIEFNG
ncbi:unnamed protein product [Sphenostylis stenocarpa]|uniref:Uncharacterized protein n=1 Tax=Sphenostylis stenocarpa TaxID=92480 RepID=A0AA86W608_9FABA|nr:unnamed protein product [Sphenostylis stenocarpa]